MRTPGAPDPLYVAARRVLLDAVEALDQHRNAIVLVGARAIYVHAGEADVAVAPYTTDGDLAINPTQLRDAPLLENALADARFAPMPDSVGIWHRTSPVGGLAQQMGVDLLVPSSLGGSGRRGAHIPPHGSHVARKVSGLEATLVDNDQWRIGALEPEDKRTVDMAVAGPAGLLVAKVYKISDRAESSARLRDKDAYDVYRLLRNVPVEEMLPRFVTLRESELARDVTATALERLPEFFGSPRALGCVMAARTAGPLENHDVLTASIVALTEELLRGLKG